MSDPIVMAARLTSKGQLTVPAEVRRHLGLREGDSLLFRVAADEVSASVRRVPRWRDLAGSFPLPDEWKDATWQEIQGHAHNLVAGRYLKESSSSTPTSSSDT